MPPRHTANTPVKVNTAISSPTSIAVASLTTSIAGLTSVRNIFGTAPTRRHTVGQMPSTHFSPRLPINPPPASAGHHHHKHQRNQPSVSSFISAGGAMIGIDANGSSKKTAAEKAAERDWQEQAKQIFQLSTVSDKGHFLPPSPSPLELGKQGSNDRFKDNDADYFTTIIIGTSPERVRTFLSTESSISPGMFSLPANKIKRNAIPSFSTPPFSSSSSASLSSSSFSEPSPTRSLSPASMNQQRHLHHHQQQQTPTVVVVVGQDKENSQVAVTPTNPPPPPYASAAAVPAVAAIPAMIPKRRVVAPADTLSTPPSSPPAISAKDMYFPPSDPTPTPAATKQSIPVTPPNSTPKSMSTPSSPSTPSHSYNSISNNKNNPRQRLRRPHQESPMHRNSRVAEEEQEEDEVDRGGSSSDRNKIVSKRRAQISFLTGVTPEDEEDLSDIFAHTVYNINSNNSSSRSRYGSSSSILSSSPR